MPYASAGLTTERTHSTLARSSEQTQYHLQWKAYLENRLICGRKSRCSRGEVEKQGRGVRLSTCDLRRLETSRLCIVCAVLTHL